MSPTTSRPDDATPNPGSEEAVNLGCLCPRMDNAYGRGAWGGAKDEDGEPVFWKRYDCPIHGKDARDGEP